jgi:hypothetical protein
MARTALLILAKLLFITAALAQNGDHVLVYGTFSPLHVSSVATGSVATGFLSSAERTGSFWAAGIGGGVTWNFLHTDPITLGLDLRGSTRPCTNGADTAMIGLRVAGRPFDSPIHPYGQVSVGYLGTRAKNTSPAIGSSGPTIGGTYTNEDFAFEFLGGVDYSFRRHLDLRVIELGIGTGTEFSLFVTNPSHPVLFTLNTGVVFHF